MPPTERPNLETLVPSPSAALGLGLRRTTSIEWTEHTWNPFVGCTRKSEGCRNCYAERMASRLELMGQPSYQGTTRRGKWSGTINRSSDATMRKPLGLAAPSVIFVNSMSDFWHENAPADLQAEALRIMADSPRHIFQILTKRPENILPQLRRLGLHRLPDHVWVGATVEDNRVADRIGFLREVPAAVRFLSVEPLIGPLGDVDLSGVHWVITGGESGPGARICAVGWLREVRDQALAQGSAFFHKQYGIPRNNPLAARYQAEREIGESLAAFIIRREGGDHGKGGAMLDGRLWRDIPGRK